MRGYVMEKSELVNYMLKYHEDKFKEKISPIKLHKTLYFLYRNWIEDGNEYELFVGNFQAWKYGPVDIDVYFNLDEMVKKEITIEGKIKDYLNFKMDYYFNKRDFNLVKISHQHKCWQNKYDEDKMYNNRPITYEEIFRDIENIKENKYTAY